jgi:hypothetical protein
MSSDERSIESCYSGMKAHRHESFFVSAQRVLVIGWAVFLSGGTSTAPAAESAPPVHNLDGSFVQWLILRAAHLSFFGALNLWRLVLTGSSGSGTNSALLFKSHWPIRRLIRLS